MNSDHRGDHHCSESAFPAPDMLLAASERLSQCSEAALADEGILTYGM